MSVPSITRLMFDLVGRGDSLSSEAAAALRDLRNDFLIYGTHHPDCSAHFERVVQKDCDCGLDAARNRWEWLKE